MHIQSYTLLPFVSSHPSPKAELVELRRCVAATVTSQRYYLPHRQSNRHQAFIRSSPVHALISHLPFDRLTPMNPRYPARHVSQPSRARLVRERSTSPLIGGRGVTTPISFCIANTRGHGHGRVASDRSSRDRIGNCTSVKSVRPVHAALSEVSLTGCPPLITCMPYKMVQIDNGRTSHDALLPHPSLPAPPTIPPVLLYTNINKL